MRIGLLLFLFLIQSISYSQELKYDLIDCEFTEEEYAEIDKLFRYELDFFKPVFKFSEPSATLRIYGDFEAYKKYQKKISSTARSDRGFYSGSKKIVVAYKDDHILKTLRHEMTHLIIRNGINKIPKWINEGFAEWFEYYRVEGDSVVPGLQETKIRKVKGYIDDKLLDLNEFLAMDNDEWRAANKQPKNFAYSVSYCIIYFLFETDQQVLLNILDAFKDGKQNTVYAIGSNFEGGFEGFKTGFYTFFSKIE